MHLRTAAPLALGLYLAATAGLAGCIGNPVKDIQDLPTANIGSVTARLAEDVTPGPSSVDESASFRHWQHRFQYCRSCYSRRLFDDTFFGAYALDPSAMANALVGVAHVTIITEEQNHAWTRLAGREWVAFKGSVRTYKPDFDPTTDELFRHPLATLETVRSFRDGEATGADAFGPFITRSLFAASVDTQKARQCWTSFADVQNQRFTQEAARARAANDNRGVTKLFEEEVVRLQQQVAKAEADADEYNALADERKEIAEAAEANAYFLRTENDRLRTLLTQRGTDPDAQVQIPDTYDELPAWCDKHLAGRLVLISRAARAARSAPYDNPSLVYRALLTLAGVYRQLRLGVVGRESYEQALHSLELTESYSISSSRVGEQGDEYYVIYPAGSTRRRLLEMHLRKGVSHEPRHALRIYYFWDEETSQVVVGWLTTHLDTRQT